MLITLSVVIHNPDIELFLSCLHSLDDSVNQLLKVKADVQVSLHVVDNSLDLTRTSDLEAIMRAQLNLSMRFEFIYIVSDVNKGYGHANNLVINSVKSKYHAVINPDVFWHEDTLIKAVDYLEANPRVSLLTPAVFGIDGERHYVCKRNPTLWILFLRSYAPGWLKQLFMSQLARYEMRDCDYENVMTHVSFPTGCFMFARTAALHEVEGFDERFFMYFEDADLGRRIAQHGEIHYVPSVRIIHKWERGTHHSTRLRWETIISALKYWRKWGGMFTF